MVVMNQELEKKEKQNIHVASCSFGKGNEIWKDIPEHPYYQASNMGRIRVLDRFNYAVRYGKPFSQKNKRQDIIAAS